MIKSIFIERLHRLLDSIDMSFDSQERANEFARLFKIPVSTSRAILAGIMPPSDALLDQITKELEVTRDWLLGKEKNN